MRKLITLLAAATLVASSFAMAETTGNSNDVLQQVQPTGTGEAPTTLADADTSSSAAAATTPDSSMDAAKPAMKHHKKHHKCKHHCNKHHHKMKPASTAETAPTTPAATDTASTPTQ